MLICAATYVYYKYGSNYFVKFQNMTVNDMIYKMYTFWDTLPDKVRNLNLNFSKRLTLNVICQFQKSSSKATKSGKIHPDEKYMVNEVDHVTNVDGEDKTVPVANAADVNK